MATPPTDPPDATADRPPRQADPAAALQESEARYRLLAEVGRLVSTAPGLREAFEGAAEAIRRVTGCDRVSLPQASAHDEQLRGFALEFTPERRRVDIPPQGLTGSAAEWVLRHHRPYLAGRLNPEGPFAEDRSLSGQGYRGCV